MTDYTVMIKHPGFMDRFLVNGGPPADIGGDIWWAVEDDGSDILLFRRRESAENCKQRYELHFAAKGEKAYSFVVMKTVMVPQWVPVEGK